MARFSYSPGDSFFHRMDPTWKLAWNLLLVIVVLFNFSVGYQLAWYLYVLALALLLADISPRQYLRSLLLVIWLPLFIVFWKLLYWTDPSTHVIWAWGPFQMTQEGMIEGMAAFFRILVILTLSIIFTSSTDPHRMVESLIQVGRLPYRLGYVAYATLRFIPIYEYEFELLRKAHLVRGVGRGKRGPLARFRLYGGLLVPLLVSGIRRAQASSIAMESRGFGAYSQRTRLMALRVRPETRVFVLAHVALAAGAFYYFIILGYGAHFLG